MESKLELTDKQVWEKYYEGKGTMRRFNSWLNRTVFDAEIIDTLDSRLASSTQNQSLIELGCGGSEWMVYVGKKFPVRLAGLDYLQVGCDKSKSMLHDAGVTNAEIYCADFFSVDSTMRRAYTYVVSFGVVEHFLPPTKALQAFGEFLADDGVIITTCPNTGGLAMGLQKYLDEGVYNNHVRFNLNQLIDYHHQAGFEVVSASYTGFLSFNNIVFSNFSIVGRLLKAGIKLFNAPLVYAFYLLKRYVGIDIQSRGFSSNMVVVAKKRRSGEK